MEIFFLKFMEICLSVENVTNVCSLAVEWFMCQPLIIKPFSEKLLLVELFQMG
jgi:hypothetical protein